MPAHDRTRFRPSLEQFADRIVPDATLPAWPAEIGQAIGAATGDAPVVHLLERGTNRETAFVPFDPAFRGGVRTAVGDVTGDNVPDVVAAAGPGGGPHVKVFDGKTGAVVRSFFAYDPAFAGGVEVAVGDVNRDGVGDVVTVAGAGGGPHVKVFDGRTGKEVASFLAFERDFRGGVYVATGDLNRDGYADVITGAGAGAGPRVQAFDLRTGGTISNFFAFDPSFTGGARVAAGDLNADGRDDLVVGAGPGGGPHVRAFDAGTGEVLSDRFVDDPAFAGGVELAVVPGFADGKDAIVARTRGGDVVRTLAYTPGASNFDTPNDVWVGVGDPPGGTSLRSSSGPVWPSNSVNPVRTLEGLVGSVAADGTSMVLNRGDGTPVTIDLDGIDPPPPGMVFIDTPLLPPAGILLGDQPATLAALRPGRWVQVQVAWARTPAEPQYLALSVRIL
jgi:hypothetical protein